MGEVIFVCNDNIWASKLLEFSFDSIKNGHIVFEGHWYAFDRGDVTLPYTVPFCHVRDADGRQYQFTFLHVLSKEDVRDTSKYFHDESITDVGPVCLFPTKVMKLTFDAEEVLLGLKANTI